MTVAVSFERSLGHGVAADVFKERPDVSGGFNPLPFEHGPEIAGDGVPAGLRVFGRVEGAFAGGTFAPSGGVVEI